jgi:hypothetical protein
MVFSGRGLATFVGIGLGGVESDSDTEDASCDARDATALRRPCRYPARLETLLVGGCAQLCDGSLRASLRRLSSLTRLDVAGCRGLTGRCLEGLSRRCPTLIRLDLPGGGFDSSNGGAIGAQGWAEVGSLSRLTRLGAAGLERGVSGEALVAGRAPDGRVVALISDVRRRGADVAKPQLVFAPAEGPGQGGTA